MDALADVDHLAGHRDLGLAALDDGRGFQVMQLEAEPVGAIDRDAELFVQLGQRRIEGDQFVAYLVAAADNATKQIGRASYRAGVCPYGLLTVVSVSFTQQT